MLSHRTVLVGCLLTAACAPAGTPDPPTPTGPRILSLSPEDGPAGTAYPIFVTIVGTGFAPTGNVVTFGDIPLAPLAATQSGTSIVFAVPKERPGTDEVAPFVLPPGEYPVTVTTPDGRSPPVVFVLTLEP